jgi:hypothetical protein
MVSGLKYFINVSKKTMVRLQLLTGIWNDKALQRQLPCGFKRDR